MKAIERTFHPENIPVLRFSIRRLNMKKYKSMTSNEKKEAIRFIEDCKGDLNLFERELKK